MNSKLHFNIPMPVGYTITRSTNCIFNLGNIIMCFYSGFKYYKDLSIYVYNVPRPSCVNLQSLSNFGYVYVCLRIRKVYPIVDFALTSKRVAIFTTVKQKSNYYMTM